MKKQLIVCSSILLSLLVAPAAHAQSDPSKESVIHVSLFDPIGTNGKEAKAYTNTFSFNLLYGRSKSERAFTLSGLASVIEEEANGVQIAGLANVIGGDANGIQLSGLANVTGGNSRGLTIAGLSNISENATGALVSGLANISEDMSGLSLSGLANIAQNTTGLQVAGLGNIAADAQGFQVSGIFNRTESFSGFQMAGLFNKTKTVKGVQLALVNIAEENDYPIGLVNLVKNGEKSVSLTFDELQNLTTAFRSGGRVLYGILGLGYNFKSSENLMAFEGGIGAHIPFPCTQAFRMNTELTSTVMTQFSDAACRSSLRLLAAWKCLPSLELFAGPSLNYLHTDEPELFDLLPDHALWKESPIADKCLYIGYQAGIQYIF